MEIKIEITRDDYADFNKYYFLHKALKRRIYLPILMVLVLPFFILSRDQLNIGSYLFYVVIAGIAFAVTYAIGITLSINRTKKLPLDNGTILGSKKYTITDEGLKEETAHSNGIQKWTGIKSIETNKNSVFIFTDKISAFVVPKRFFKDTVEQEHFIRLIKEKINNAQ